MAALHGNPSFEASKLIMQNRLTGFEKPRQCLRIPIRQVAGYRNTAVQMPGGLAMVVVPQEVPKLPARQVMDNHRRIHLDLLVLMPSGGPCFCDKT